MNYGRLLAMQMEQAMGHITQYGELYWEDDIGVRGQTVIQIHVHILHQKCIY